MSKQGNKLTPKQRLFVREYLVALNATRAAKAAGYSERTANEQGARLLANVSVAAEIARLFEKREAKLDLSTDRLFLELARLALSDPRKFYREDGSLKPVTELDDDTAAALQGMEIEEAYEHFGKGQAKPTGVLKKIKWADKGLNIERLLKYKHRIGDKVEHALDGDLAEFLRDMRAKDGSSGSGRS